MTDEGARTYAKGRILLSSEGRGWRGISAELRSHPAGERPANVLSVTEIAVMVRGTAVVTRQAEGVRQHIVTSSGTIGLSPASVREDYKRVETDIDEMLHIYLSPSPFAALAKHTSESFDAASVRYDAGFRDPLIEQIAAEILGELRFETSCGDLLVETLADVLAVRLLNNYSSIGAGHRRASRRSRGLDARRLQRVTEYIDANLQKEITVDALASAASLSRFHFSRMFKVTTGQSPSRFIGQRRLDLAKSRLVQGASIAQVAFDCGFSSESNFIRSFRRATGLTPGQHRDRVPASIRCRPGWFQHSTP
ncbi:AraC family transcriptional regulator [Mycobacterium sp. KBS0706]|uniref:AraC family transcriptional regulator n=1 Tax=Mycobacterium sp. KBS0706 TaxID=2578109 RepID=UPI0027D25FF4|nr:AraC family transcriptional regulator [Mycobacterium sp. KBS0706]